MSLRAVCWSRRLTLDGLLLLFLRVISLVTTIVGRCWLTLETALLLLFRVEFLSTITSAGFFREPTFAGRFFIVALLIVATAAAVSGAASSSVVVALVVAIGTLLIATLV